MKLYMLSGFPLFQLISSQVFSQYKHVEFGTSESMGYKKPGAIRGCAGVIGDNYYILENDYGTRFDFKNNAATIVPVLVKSTTAFYLTMWWSGGRAPMKFDKINSGSMPENIQLVKLIFINTLLDHCHHPLFFGRYSMEFIKLIQINLSANIQLPELIFINTFNHSPRSCTFWESSHEAS